MRRKGKTTDTSKQLFFKSPYSKSNDNLSKMIKKVQGVVRKFKNSR